MNLIRTHDAKSEALSVTDVKNHLRITSTDDDDALRVFIEAVRHRTETYLGKTLVQSTWELKLDDFETDLVLPMGPVQSVSSVSYVDTDGATQSFANFQVDRKGRIKPAYGYEWPEVRDQYDAVTITYVCGETHAGNVQQDIKLAMLLWIGSSDMNRENEIIGTIISEIPKGAESLLAPYRVQRL